MKNQKKMKRTERLAVILVSLLFFAAAVYGGIRLIVQAPPAPDLDQTPTQDTQPDGAETTIPNSRARKEYCYNILVSGLDDGNGGSDTNLLVRFDAKGKSVDVVSLPRDTLLHLDKQQAQLRLLKGRHAPSDGRDREPARHPRRLLYHRGL